MVSLAVSRGCEPLVRNFMIYGGKVLFSVFFSLVSSIWQILLFDLSFQQQKLTWLMSAFSFIGSLPQIRFRQDFHKLLSVSVPAHLLSILHLLPHAPFCLHSWASVRGICFCLLSWFICKWGRCLNLAAALSSVKINFRPTFLTSCIPVEMALK